MGFLDKIFSSEKKSVEFATIPQTEEAKKARAKLSELSEGPFPTIPRRKIAPLSPITEERKLARTTAKELIQPQDIFQLPEVQGIIQEVTEQGNLLTNRLGRGLQAAGAFVTTSGRDILGRAVTDVQQSLTAVLAPFAAEERRRRTGLIPVLEGLGLTEELRAQGFTQDELNALFQQETIESQQVQTFLIPLLQSIIGLQPGIQPIIQGGDPSIFSQVASAAGPILGAALLGSLLGPAGGGGSAGTYGGAPGFFDPSGVGLVRP